MKFLLKISQQLNKVAIISTCLMPLSYAATESGSVTINGEIGEPVPITCDLVLLYDGAPVDFSGSASPYKAVTDLDLGTINYDAIPTLSTLKSRLTVSGPGGTLANTNIASMQVQLNGIYNTNPRAGWNSFTIVIDCLASGILNTIRYQVEQNPNSGVTGVQRLAFDSGVATDYVNNLELHAFMGFDTALDLPSFRWHDFTVSPSAKAPVVSFFAQQNLQQSYLNVAIALVRKDVSSQRVGQIGTYTATPRFTFSYN